MRARARLAVRGRRVVGSRQVLMMARDVVTAARGGALTDQEGRAMIEARTQQGSERCPYLRCNSGKIAAVVACARSVFKS